MKYIRHRWPLIERRMSRHDCLRWLKAHGYAVPPKSACIGCPFTDDRRWRERKAAGGQAWQEAVEADRSVRKLAGAVGDYYLHRSCRPLDEIDFSSDIDRGQVDAFQNECEGMCGV